MIPVLLLVVFITLAQAQYGVPPAQNYPQYGTPPQYNVPQLIDNYVCSIEAGYALFNQYHNRRKSSRPIRNFCVDVHKPDSCQRCCEMAARIGGTTTQKSDIFGFHMVLKREFLCICCAPALSRPINNQAPPAANPTSPPQQNYY